MNLTIDLSEQNTATLEAQARAARMPANDYLSKIVARVLDHQRSRNTENLDQHLAEMAARIAKETTPAEMEAALEEALIQVRPHRTWQS
jgi:hypothetical protein